MLFHFALLAESNSRTNLDWWFDRLGMLGLILFFGGTCFWYLLPEIKNWVKSQANVNNTLAVHFPQQTSSIQEIGRRVEDVRLDTAEIRTVVCKGNRFDPTTV